MTRSVPDILDTCPAFQAQRRARLLSRRFDVAFRPLGITTGQFFLMVAVDQASAATISAVSERLVMDRSTVTANLKPLLRAGYVVVAVNAHDRRVRLVTLTSTGRDLMLEATRAWRIRRLEIVREARDQTPAGARPPRPNRPIKASAL